MNKKEEKEEKYQLMLNKVKSDGFYEDAIFKFKEMYISGLGTAYMKRTYGDISRKVKVQQVLVDYVDYLHKKNLIKDVDKQVNSLYTGCFSLFANMAFNKEMYPDASLEKYINEAPEITKNIKSLLVKDLPEILIHLKDLRKRKNLDIGSYISSESELIDYFSHASVAKLIENTFIDRFNEHFEKDRDIHSESNQKFLSEKFSHKLNDIFCEFPKAAKALKTINLNVIDALAEILLLEKDNEKFNKEFEKLSDLWKRTIKEYHKEDLLTGNMSEVFIRYIENLSILETEKFFQNIRVGTFALNRGGSSIVNKNIENLNNLINNYNPNYKSELLIKQNAIEDLGIKTVYRREIKIKEKYFLDIIKNPLLADKVDGDINVSRVSEKIEDENYIKREHFLVINIETKEPLELEASIIIENINEILSESGSITEKMCSQLIRVLELKNQVAKNGINNNERIKKKL